LAYYAKSRQNLGEADLINQQYLAGNNVSFIESLCSIIATEVSALTFLGIPAFAFNHDYSFIHVYIGAVVARLIIAFVFLPRIYRKGLTLYSIMAKDGGSELGQRLTSLFFTLTKLLSVGVRLFSGSIIVASFFSINIYLAVFIICFITFFYTLIGGLKAVVRTDLVQMSLFVLGGIFAHYYIPSVGELNWNELMNIAHQARKTSFFEWNNPMPFIIGFLGGVIFDSATHGVDQDFAQRLMATSSLKKAQLAITLSSILSIAIGFLFLSIGSLLWAHYQHHPLPSGISADQLFAHFITNYFPTGIRSIMVAGVLAATMSTLDSTINALSSCFYNDIVGDRDLSKLSYYYKIDTLFITFLLMLVAYVASTSDGLLMLGLKVQSWTAGALLALFVTTLIFAGKFKADLTAGVVVGAYFFGLLGVYLNNNIFQNSWHLNTYFGFAMAVFWITGHSYFKRIKNSD
jgi:SSS family transporter